MLLPLDPENMNGKRATCAGKAVTLFMTETGVDQEDALCDLLADLIHWCDRNDDDFDKALSRARWHYEAEVASD